MHKEKGFSLIELLIVVAIILIIAAIAIPNLLRAKISANESSAVGSIRNIITAEASANSGYPQYGYPATLVLLGPGAGNTVCPATGPDPTKGVCLLDSSLASSANSTKSGYMFEAVGNNASPADPITGIVALTGFTASADPVKFNQTGVRLFCAGDDGVLRQNPNTGGKDGAGRTLIPGPLTAPCCPGSQCSSGLGRKARQPAQFLPYAPLLGIGSGRDFRVPPFSFPHSPGLPKVSEGHQRLGWLSSI